MNTCKNSQKGVSNMNKVSRTLTLIFTLAGLFLPGMVQARVTGIWDTTGLTRIDIVAINGPGVRPEHTVEIADGSYTFGKRGNFRAGDISGLWQQQKTQYTVRVNRLALENKFRKGLEQTPGLIVNQVKLLKSRLSGNQLDNGIWGSERYEYSIDTSMEGRREVIRLVMTVNIAGHARPKTLPQATSQAAFDGPTIAASPVPNSHITTAVSALVNHLHRLDPSTP